MTKKAIKARADLLVNPVLTAFPGGNDLHIGMVANWIGDFASAGLKLGIDPTEQFKKLFPMFYWILYSSADLLEISLNELASASDYLWPTGRPDANWKEGLLQAVYCGKAARDERLICHWPRDTVSSEELSSVWNLGAIREAKGRIIVFKDGDESSYYINRPGKTY